MGDYPGRGSSFLLGQRRHSDQAAHVAHEAHEQPLADTAVSRFILWEWAGAMGIPKMQLLQLLLLLPAACTTRLVSPRLPPSSAPHHHLLVNFFARSFPQTVSICPSGAV